MPEPIVELWTEANDDGVVVREVGLDDRGRVVHRMPSEVFPHGTYGLFDMAVVSPEPQAGDPSRGDFDERWGRRDGCSW